VFLAALAALDQHVEQVKAASADLVGMFDEPSSRPAGPAPAWNGPPEIREFVVQRHGEDYARSWLDPCRWGEEGDQRVIVPATNIAAEKLNRDVRRELAELGVAIGPASCGPRETVDRRR
jgi:hypothetical protein